MPTFRASLLLLAALPAAAAAQPEAAPLPPPVELPPGPPPVSPPETPPEAPPPPKPAPDPFGLGTGGPAPFFNPVVGQAPFRVDFRSAWFPDEPVSGQPTHLGYEEEDLKVTFPLWQDCANEWSGSVKVKGEFFQTHAILPDTGQRFPDQLWDVQFGTTYRHLFDNGWIAGGTVSVGSASDVPFHSINEMTAGVNAFLRIPSGEHNAWLFTLSYSPTAELAFPIPGVAYFWHPSDNFQANIGLPFMVMYRPWEDLTLEASYMLLRTVHARITYRINPSLRAYVGFDLENESWFLVDRPSDQDRFFYYEARVTAGARILLHKGVSLDLSGGYVFDRFYFEGQSFGNNGFNRVDVGAGPLLAVQAQLRW
jgi:hypothetical protein